MTVEHRKADHGTGFGAESDLSQRYHEPGSCFPKLTKAVLYRSLKGWRYPPDGCTRVEPQTSVNPWRQGMNYRRFHSWIATHRALTGGFVLISSWPDFVKSQSAQKVGRRNHPPGVAGHAKNHSCRVLVFHDSTWHWIRPRRHSGPISRSTHRRALGGTGGNAYYGSYNLLFRRLRTPALP